MRGHESIRAMLAFMFLVACSPVEPGVARESLPSAHTLFLDFAGETITLGANDDASNRVSSLAGASIPAFDAAIVAPDVPPTDVVSVVVDRVRTLFGPFALDIVTTRPATGDYAAVTIGGTAAALVPAAPSDSAGLGPVDCGDKNARSLGFAFSDSLSPEFGGVVALASTIAHEAGHGYGLEHIGLASDPMYSVANPHQTLDDLFALRFGQGSYSSFAAGGGIQPEQCGRVDPLDDVAILDAALGARTPPSAPPTVHIDFPPSATSAPSMVPVRVTATDDVAIVRVEVYSDLSLVAVLTTPPYETTLALPSATFTRITVDAIDADAQRATAHVEFAVDPSSPALCDATTPCAAGACTGGNCVVTVPVDAAVPGDASIAIGSDTHGCNFGGAGTPAWWVVVLSLLACVRLRSRS